MGNIEKALRLAKSMAQRASQEYGPSVRKEIFDALSFTPEEQGFSPLTKKGWLHGSEAPKDVDGDKYDWIRIFGLGGAATAAGLGATPDEAEAAGHTKGITKAIGELIESSAASRLKGSQMMIGDELRTIDNVFKGKGNKRIIRFTDGLEIAKDKSEIHHLAREIGTRVYTGALEGKSEAEQLAQAIRSLRYHQSRGNPWFTKEHKSDLMKEHRVIIQNLGGGDVVEHVWVVAGPGMKNRFYMPKAYADILEKHGLITIPGKKINVEE